MEDYEVKKWAGFGKATAWTLGIAATLGAVYGAGAIVYSSGKDTGAVVAKDVAAKESRAREESLSADYNGKINAANQAKDQLAKEQEAALKRLVQDGRLIPEDSCLRYSTSQSAVEGDYSSKTTDEIVSGNGAKCGTLEMRLSWTTPNNNSAVQSFSASYGDNKAIFTPGTDYKPATVDLQVRKRAEWIPYQKK